MKKLSQALNLTPIALGFLLTTISMLFLAWVYMEDRGSDREVVPYLMLVAAIPATLSGLLIIRVVYKLWKAIQGGHPRTSPELAVGLLFVPFFNLYWVFQAYWGLARDYNAYVRQHRLKVPTLSEGLALSVCVLMLLSMVPLLGFLFMLVNMILQIILVAKMISRFNSLSEATPLSQA